MLFIIISIILLIHTCLILSLLAKYRGAIISLIIFFFFSFSVDNIDKLKARLGSLENELRDSLKFKDFYHFTFNYAKNTGQKGLDLDMAIAYWNIVLDDKFKFLQLWCQFLQVRNL